MSGRRRQRRERRRRGRADARLVAGGEMLLCAVNDTHIIHYDSRIDS